MMYILQKMQNILDFFIFNCLCILFYKTIWWLGYGVRSRSAMYVLGVYVCLAKKNRITCESAEGARACKQTKYIRYAEGTLVCK